MACDWSRVRAAPLSGIPALRITVDSRGAKRRAEDIAENVPGLRHVQNDRRVQQSTNQGTANGTTGRIGISSAGTDMRGA